MVFSTKNPFLYGRIAVNGNFIGRSEEIARLLNSIKLGESSVIYSPNGMGKSSLLAELARRYSKDFIFVPIDLTGITNEATLLNLVTRGTMRAAYGRLQNYPPEAWELLANPRLRRAVVEDIESGSSGNLRDRLPTFSAPRGTDLGELLRLSDTRTQIRMCPRCGSALKWLEKYSRYYCFECKGYAPKGIGGPPHIASDKRHCPVCKQSMKFIQEYNEWYCFKCKKYTLRPSKPVLLL